MICINESDHMKNVPDLYSCIFLQDFQCFTRITCTAAELPIAFESFEFTVLLLQTKQPSNIEFAVYQEQNSITAAELATDFYRGDTCLQYYFYRNKKLFQEDRSAFVIYCYAEYSGK